MLLASLDYSRTFLQKLVKEAPYWLTDAPSKAVMIYKRATLFPSVCQSLKKARSFREDIPIDIVYEDDYLMLINKPYDMVVHPAGRHHCGTVVNALAFHCQNLSQVNGPLKAGIVHRLDRDTSGIMLTIKSDAVHSHIAMQFEKDPSRRNILLWLRVS